MNQAKQAIARLKPYLRWVIFGGTLFFLASTLKRHWAEVTELQVDATGWALLVVALGVTLLAHIWSGLVWSAILRELNQPAEPVWGIRVYLKTNIAKYLPGNVWHLYGRVMASKQAGFPIGAATLSVLLEPLLMAAAALVIALVSAQSEHGLLQGLSLAIVLLAVHPRVLNPLLKLAKRLKGQAKHDETGEQNQANAARDHQESQETHSNQEIPSDSGNQQVGVREGARSLQIKRYPLLPLLGEVMFVLLRGLGFVLTVLILSPVELAQLPVLFSAFSFAWLLGLVIPGAPGGIGVFEATAIALLNAHLPPAVILGSVAFYRLISTLAEAAGAGLAWLDEDKLSMK